MVSVGVDLEIRGMIDSTREKLTVTVLMGQPIMHTIDLLSPGTDEAYQR